MAVAPVAAIVDVVACTWRVGSEVHHLRPHTTMQVSTTLDTLAANENTCFMHWQHVVLIMPGSWVSESLRIERSKWLAYLCTLEFACEHVVA
jgi:hypothetical protein